MPIDNEILQRLERNDPTLTELDLSEKKLTDVDIVPLAKVLAKNSTLTALYLSRNQVRAAGAEALSGALAKNSTLTAFDLRSNQVSDAGAKALSKAVAKNSTLTTLSLSDNEVGDAGAKALSEALVENATLTTLNLGSNLVGAAGAKALSEALAKNATLTTLMLYNNNIGYVGATALSEALAKNETLTELNLRNNQVGAEGAKALINQKLAQNRALRLERNDPTLTKLDLSMQNLTDADIVPLAKALAKNATLTELNLGNNQVGAAGAKALSEALTKNSTLTALFLYSNQVGVAGTKALSKALAKNATLTTVFLTDNQIGDAGAKALGEGLGKNSTLTTLHLVNNQVGDAGAKALSEALTKNTTLTILNLDYNKASLFSRNITEATHKTIDQKLAQNKALAEKKQESKSSAVSNPGVVARSSENKNIPIEPIPSSGSSDIKDFVSSSFSSEVKTNALPSHHPITASGETENKQSSTLPKGEDSTQGGFLSSVTAVGGWLLGKVWSQKNTFDEEAIEKLQKLADEMDAPKTYVVTEDVDVLRKKLAGFETAIQHLDGEALSVLQGKAQEVRTLIDQATEQHQAEAERNNIEFDDCLCDYYYVLRSQLLHMWLACQVIHSEMVDNDKKTKLDYLAENIDKLAGRFPGLSLLTGFIKGAASGWSYREKKAAMQHMSAFCLGLVEGDTVIDTLARQLTLSQELTLKAKLAPVKTGTFRKALAVFKKAKNWALVNDIDNATKEFAAKQASQILEAVMKGKIKTPCRPKDIPQLYSLVMGVNAVYQSPIALPNTTNSLNPNAASNGANASISVQQTQSYSRMQVTLNAAPNTTAKEEIAELKQWKAEQEKRAQEQEKRAKEQEEKMKAMQEELSRVKNQNQAQEPIVQKRDFESLQTEFNRLKAESQKNGSQVQKQDFDHLQRELKKLKEGLEQAGMARGGNQLQISGTAFGAGTVTSEQRQIAALQQQVSFLTAHVLTTQEQQSPQDEAEDPARLKLLI